MRPGSPFQKNANHKKRLARSERLAAACIISAITMASGCGGKPDGIEVLSFRNPEQPETFVENFPAGHFRMNSERTYEIVLELEPRLLEVPAPEELPASTLQPDEADSPDPESTENAAPTQSQPAPPDLVWTSQFLQIQLLWQPIPGKTYAESTQTNAAIIYCLVNGDNAISYEGAGFVFFKLSRDGKELEGRIESASLRPTRFQRDPVDLFGPCRISGEFTATEGSREVASVRQRLRRLLGKPSTGIEGPN